MNKLRQIRNFFNQLPPFYRLLLLFEILGFLVIVTGFALLMSMD